MALKDENGNTGYTAPPAGPAPTAGGQAPQKKSFGFFNIAPTAGMSRTPASEVLVKAIAALSKMYAEDLSKDMAYNVDVLPVDNAKETRLSLSAIVVCARSKALPNQGVFYHTLVLEGSGEPLTDKMENWQGRQIAVSRFAADVFNKTYQDTVQNIVQRAFPNKPCYAISGQVVPRNFNWEDKDALRSLAANAAYPSLTQAETYSPDFVDIDLTAWQHDASLQVRLNFNEGDKVDYAGLPVRNNVSVELIATELVKANQQDINQQDRNKKITSLGGFIDLVWVPEEQGAGNAYGYAQPAQGPRHKFGARFVITNMENHLRSTLPSQILAFDTALGLSEGNSWYPYYAPRPQGTGGRAIDPRDIGAINIEANIFNDPSGYGAPVDTKAASFTKLNLGGLIQATVRPGITVAIDVSDLGADTWYNEAFYEAASGNLKAAMAILDAANYLTGGIFAKHYNSSENPMVVNEDRVHLGYYVLGDGQRHDIRDIDYLAIMNLSGVKDPGVGQAWTDTFLRTEYPLIQRLDARKKMITDSVPGAVTFTGMARRVMPTNRFLLALAVSCREAGLDARLVSPALNGGYEDQRGVATYLPQTQILPGTANVFAPGYAGQGAVFGGQQRYTGGRY